MTPITIKTGAVKSSCIGLNVDILIISGIKEGISHLRHKVDVDIQARRNISSRMNEAQRAAGHLEQKLHRLHSFVNNAAANYSNADHSIEKQIPGSWRDRLQDIMDKFSHGIPGCGNDELSFWDKLKTGAGAVTAGAKNTWASWKKKIEPGGEWYRAYQLIKTGAKLVLDIALVALAIAAVPVTGGTSIFGAIYAFNDLLNSSVDMGLALSGDYTKMGQVNVLKDGLESGLGWCAKKVGMDEKYGRYAADAIYYTGSMAAIYYSLPKAVRSLDHIWDIKNVIKMKDIKPTFKNLLPEVKKLANYDVGKLAKQANSPIVAGKSVFTLAKELPALNKVKEAYGALKDIYQVEKEILGGALT